MVDNNEKWVGLNQSAPPTVCSNETCDGVMTWASDGSPFAFDASLMPSGGIYGNSIPSYACMAQDGNQIVPFDCTEELVFICQYNCTMGMCMYVFQEVANQYKVGTMGCQLRYPFRLAW